MALPNSQRKQIRAFIVDLLKGIEGVAATGQAVFANRSRKVFPEEMPALIVYTRSEQAELGLEAPRSYERRLRVGIEIITDTKDDADSPDDVVDDIGAEIERRMFKDETLSGLVSDVRLSDTDMETNSDGETQHAASRITFEIHYWTDAPEEQTDLDDFETVHSEMLPSNAIEGDTEPAVDDIALVEED